VADTSTVVGETILVSGNLSGDEDLLVLGKVEGSISLTKTLHVQESGIVKANVQVKNAIISGIVVGNIQASDSVEITEQGRMVGDIKAPRIIIVEGASFRGHIDMGDLEAQRPSGPLPARSENRPALGAPRRPALGAPITRTAVPAPAKAATPAPAAAKPAAPAPAAAKAPVPPPPKVAVKAPAPPPKPAATVVAGGKKKVVVKK
jgi:cytoskeletal protein CcmA (bactofilin family)